METQLINEQTESVKLIKNTKGYNWEIRVLGTDIPRLQALNAQLEALYGKVMSEEMPS